MRISSGAATDTNNNATILGLGSEPNGWSKCGIAHVRTGPYDQGDIVFLCRNTGDSVDCNLTNERMRISSSGNININNNLTIGGRIGIGTSTINCPLQLATQAIPKQICLYEVTNNNFNFVGFGNGGGMKLQINDMVNDSLYLM